MLRQGVSPQSTTLMSLLKGLNSGSGTLSWMHRRNTSETFLRGQNNTKAFTDKIQKISKSLAKAQVQHSINTEHFSQH